jgi:hypothetical protein
MEAHLTRAVLCAAALLSMGAGYRTQNFIVDADSPAVAREVGDMAEKFRHDLAIEWLGKPLDNWPDPCPIRVTVGNMGAGGATSFMFERGRPFGWTMSVQGTRERVLDSVLPHEVTHAIFATHFGRPLPRWADEGACTTVEHHSERKKQEDNLKVFLTTNRGIAFNQMFAMTEYPPDVLPLYSQGYSLARFLIAQGGKPKFVEYVGDGMNSRNWTAATKKHYGFESLSELQVTWVEWVRGGSREDTAAQMLVAMRGGEKPTTATTPVDSDRVQAIPAGYAKTSAPANAPVREPLGKLASREVPAQFTSSQASEDPRPHGGWYARRRDEARTSVATNQSVSTPLGTQPLDTSHEKLPEAVMLSRPQPLSQPQQTILEWSRPPQPSTLPGTVLR